MDPSAHTKLLPIYPDCGVSEEYRINTASHGEHPWMVIIYKDDKVICGGSLINPQFVLTGKTRQ